MTKKKEKKVNVSGKPKHSLDANRSNDKKSSSNSCSAATVRRLNMYNTRPVRDRKGKILKNELQSKDLPSTQIQPNRRWFVGGEDDTGDVGAFVDDMEIPNFELDNEVDRREREVVMHHDVVEDHVEHNAFDDNDLNDLLA
ncbi:hypothetical protein K1719_009510 [Acacia pycnantha]|nr:hypothetical protein K1719_009510 [Acacia pycnantha]